MSIGGKGKLYIGEARVSPFKRLGRLFSGKLESLTATAEKQLDTKANAAMSQAASAPKATAPKQQPAAGGMLMGAGVTIAALGSALAYITKTLSEAHPGAIACSVVGAILVVMLPTGVLAFLKLRGRDLSAILEASGWGINARMRLTRSQRLFFTQRPGYPTGSRGAPKSRARLVVILLLVILLIAAAAVIIPKVYRWRSQPATATATATSQPATPSEAPPEQ